MPIYSFNHAAANAFFQQSAGPHIGPHEGAEAELLIAGDKPVGIFSGDQHQELRRLEPYVNNGQLVRMQHGSDYYFCQREKQRDMMELFRILEEGELSGNDRFKRIGEILGYDDSAIHYFIQYLIVPRALQNFLEQDDSDHINIMAPVELYGCDHLKLENL